MAATNILSLDTARTRRRMILAALRPVLNDVQLEAALNIWQANFSHLEKFPYTAYSRMLQELVPGSPPAGELLTLLAESTRLDDTQLGEDPLPRGASTGFGTVSQLGTITEPRRRPQAASVSSTGTRTYSGNAYHLAAANERSDAEAVFSAVLTAIVTRIEPEFRQELREYMEVTVGSLGLASEALPAMRAWCVRIADHPEPVEAPLSQHDMRSVVHHLYCWCCELNGPVGADKLFNTAMQLVQRMPQARSLDPRTLL